VLYYFRQGWSERSRLLVECKCQAIGNSSSEISFELNSDDTNVSGPSESGNSWKNYRRDLKSGNVLVSNAHYAQLEGQDVHRAWAVRPVIAKLTDSGEAHSSAVKTHHNMTTTVNRRHGRGSSAYQAPEVYTAAHLRVDLVDLKRMYIWSYAMVLFDLLEPGAYHKQTWKVCYCYVCRVDGLFCQC